MSNRIARRSTRADAGVKVTVTEGIRVVHDGQPYRDGQTVTVPESVARRWIRNGWASDSGPSVLADPRGLASHDSDTEPEAEVEASTGNAKQPTRVRAGTVRRDPRKPKAGNDDE